MSELPIKILEIFDVRCEKEKPVIWLATIDNGKPHLAPVCFVKTVEKDKLLVANVFISKTEKNIKRGSKVAAGVVIDVDGRDGYLIKGSGKVLDKGWLFEDFYREIVDRSSGKRKPRSAILITIEEIYSLKPFSGKKKIWPRL